jgi:hypothetical protein
MFWVKRGFGAVAILLVLSGASGWAGVGGRISGVVRDQAGKAIPGASVSAREVGTGLSYEAQTDGGGYYALPSLPVGSYELTAEAAGFASYRRREITLDTNASLAVDVTLAVGGVAETVSVTDNTLHVETTSTQMGEAITARQMEAVPLDGRSFTDLLSLQPGVAPATSITPSTVEDVGATTLSPSGTLNPGTISVNGQREFANAFLVNGSNAEEDVNEGTAIVPNLDAIAEFRIVANNFDAEYGEYSGGQISVVTKSGTNEFHGGVFEFLRNTDLDARNYFSPERGAFRQNQFGGTFGGPLRRDKAFFFLDYQGTRQTQGVDTGVISVPSSNDRGGNLSDLAASLATTQTINGAQVSEPTTVSGPYLAGQVLSPKLGYAVTAGEPYYYTAGESVPDGNGAVYSTDCVSSAQCVFPNAVVPRQAWSGPAQELLQYIPAPNTASGFATSAYNQILRDDKAGARVDVNTRWGLVSGYYFIDDYTLDNPYPVAQSGASVPGFNALTTGRAQLFSLGDTKTFGSAAVNEFHLSYMRDFTDLGSPVGGRGVSLASQGFVNADGSPSIVPLDPKGQSVENVNFDSFSIGAAANELIQANNSYQAADSFARVLGAHTLKLGADFHADQVNANPVAQFNGSFVFSAGNETGSDFADFLVGVPSQYNQSQLNPFYARNKYLGIFGEDSWHVAPGLVLNYGLRWDRIAPWSEKYNQISTFVPGAQSVVFPGAPAGILYPGDPGVPRTLAPVGNLDFSPRVGLAWSPTADSGSLLGKALGAPGTTSIRAGFGNFYTAIEALTIGVLAANAPYGTTYSSPAPPLFATPFVTASNGQNFGQPFPYTFAPLNSSRSHPDANFDWSSFEPISGIPGFSTANRIPYTEEWMLSVERQAGPKTVLTASYVGTSSHRLLVLRAENAGDPALCLSLASVGCGPFGEGNVYVTASDQTINGTRTQLGPSFGSDALQTTIGHADYNALEASARHTSGRLEFFAAYTYGKSLDESSNVGEEVNPVDPARSYALSSYDVRHNFVVSYDYQLPFAELAGRPNRWTSMWAGGWSFSGISHFSTGFPVTMVNPGDNSLLGTNPNGINNSSIDEPDYSGGPLHLNRNPRKNGGTYFDANQFGMNALGTTGTAKRRFFHGPGAENFDMALAKNVALGDAKSLTFRIEAFNVFNHAQFTGPSAVDGNLGSGTFGNVIGAAPARVMQAAARFSF